MKKIVCLVFCASLLLVFSLHAEDGVSVKATDTDAEARYNRGINYATIGDYDRAIAELSEAIDLKPDDADAYDSRGDVYQKKGDYDLAIADYTKAIDLRPYSFVYYSSRGGAYRKKGDYDLAIADYTKAIDLMTDGTRDDISNLALTFYTAATGIKLDDFYSLFYRVRGDVYEEKDNYDLAIADYTKAIDLKPEDASYYNLRGYAYQRKGDYDLAIADYTKAIDLKPEDVDSRYFRVAAYKLKGDYVQALKEIDIALKLFPDNSTFLDMKKAVEVKKTLDVPLLKQRFSNIVFGMYFCLMLYLAYTSWKAGDMKRLWWWLCVVGIGIGIGCGALLISPPYYLGIVLTGVGASCLVYAAHQSWKAKKIEEGDLLLFLGGSCMFTVGLVHTVFDTFYL